MPYHCVAFGCGKTLEDGVTLFKFPKDPDEFRKWEKQVQRMRPWWAATPYSHLCSDHFGKEYFESKLLPTEALKLRPGAAPTVFVRPHCSSCSGAGCKRCLPAIQRRSLTAETNGPSSSVSSQGNTKKLRIRSSPIPEEKRMTNDQFICCHAGTECWNFPLGSIKCLSTVGCKRIYPFWYSFFFVALQPKILMDFNLNKSNNSPKKPTSD
uniref:THAP domain-containing protein 1 n=1 Tax=Kryptolebias marmoratus TaxID=37003 RepID=A0A3Q3ABY1_KRYMA